MRFFSIKAIDGATVYINVEKISMICSSKGSAQAKVNENVATIYNTFMPEEMKKEYGINLDPQKDITEIYVSGSCVKTYVPVEEILKKLKEI